MIFKVVALKAQLARWQDAEPTLELIVKGPDGKPTQSLSASVPFHPGLSAEDIARLVDEVQTRYPKATDFGLDPPPGSPREDAVQAILKSVNKWQAPEDQAIEEYRRAYDEWIGQARLRFERLDFVLNVSTRMLPLQLELRSTGSRPADEVLFKITSHTGLKFCISEDDEIPKTISQIAKVKREIPLDTPPKAPKGEFMVSAFARIMRGGGVGPSMLNPGGLLPKLHAMPLVIHRDRHAFYRQDDKSGLVTSCSFSRAEFRHRADRHVFRVWVVISPEIAPTRSHLHCRISARNMIKPLHARIPLALEYQQRATLDVAKRWSVK